MTEKEQVEGWIDVAYAAERLGVKPATLYAYVSRGVLRRRTEGRRSLFDAAQVEELARRGRPRRAPGPGDLAIESAVTALGPDRPYYRGRDVLDLASTARFEDVATWLWTGDDTPGAPWRADPAGVAAAVAAQSGLPAGLLPLDRLQLIVTALAVTDPRRHTLDPAGVAETGRALIAGLIEALPPAAPIPPSRQGHASGDARGAEARSADVEQSPRARQKRSGPSSAGGSVDETVAERLWGRLRLSGSPMEEGLARAAEAAMILLADHELAASTVAARVAASVRADPYAVVASGLGVLGGPLHGGASYGVERLLADVGDPADAARVVGERLRAGDRVPGFGHPVYKKGDARAVLLLDLIRETVPGHPRIAAAEAVMAAMERRRLPAPNIDFALGLLGTVAGLTPGAGEALFAIARVAGWLAHAIEEYDRRAPLRPRAVYTGPAPG